MTQKYEMRSLVLTPKFKRAFRKFVKRNADLQKLIEDTLQQMEADVFAPNLGTHKLSGKLDGLQSCSCGYDCRIVFSIEPDTESDDEVIVLLDIGTHDEVY
jgi:mRNA interferase YafQ